MIAANYFALPASLARFAPFFAPDVAPWEWLPRIGSALAAAQIAPWSAPTPPALRIEGAVWIDPSVKLPHIGTILGPAWIGPDCELRPGVFVRGNVIAGAGCVLGNACEFKNCLLMDAVEVPHFSYVGDSILGNRAHLGAGVVLSNLRLDRQHVIVRPPEGPAIDTGLRKFGAIFGDGAEAGCNAVLNPGTLLGPRALVAPATAVSGCVPAAHIARVRGRVEFVPRRD